MNTDAILPVARVQGSFFVVYQNGRPVWPVRGTKDREDLAQLAKVFGTRVVNVSAREGRSARGKELVVGLGPESYDAAALYSHLTTRKLQLTADARDGILSSRLRGVVITTSEMLTFELLDRLFGDPLVDSLAGIIVANNSEELHRQVLFRSAASVLRGRLREPRIDINATLPVGNLRQRKKRVLGQYCSPKEIRRAIGAGAGLLNIMTHSDGVDAFFGATTLCPIQSLADFKWGPRPPKCVVRGVCHRHDITLGQAMRAKFLLRPSEVAARLLVFHTCRGVLPADSLVDPEWGLLRQLLSSPKVGAVATTWEIVGLVAGDLERVARQLDHRLPAGKALARFANNPAVRLRKPRFCLFGDPRLILPD